MKKCRIAETFFKRIRTPLEKHIIHLPSSCERETSTKFVSLEFTIKLWLSPNNRNMGLPCFKGIWIFNGTKMAWYFECLFLFSLFRTNVKKWNLDENDFSYCYSNFWKCHSGNYVITAIFKAHSQHLWSTFTIAFWKTPYNRRILHAWNNIHANSFIKTSKTSWNKKWRRCLGSYKLHKNPSLHLQ